MIAIGFGSHTTARQAFEPSVVSLHYGGETCLAKAPPAQSKHPTRLSVLLQALDGSGNFRLCCWTDWNGVVNTKSFSNWTTGSSRTLVYRERSSRKRETLLSLVGATVGDCSLFRRSSAAPRLAVRGRRVCRHGSDAISMSFLRTPACHVWRRSRRSRTLRPHHRPELRTRRLLRPGSRLLRRSALLR